MKDDELIAALWKHVFYGDQRLLNFKRHSPLAMEVADYIEALTAEVERLKKSGAAILAEKHREQAEAKLWFGEFQHLRAEVERKDAALQAYLDAFDKGTGTVYVEPIIRAALQPQEKVG